MLPVHPCILVILDILHELIANACAPSAESFGLEFAAYLTVLDVRVKVAEAVGVVVVVVTGVVVVVLAGTELAGVVVTGAVVTGVVDGGVVAPLKAQQLLVLLAGVLS